MSWTTLDDMLAARALRNAAPVLMPPCPFCEGPPVAIVTKAEYPYGSAPLQDDYGDDGLSAEAYVFCHECGAEGPHAEYTIHDREDYHALERLGVQLWVQRDADGRSCYDAGNAEGLNFYPRPGETHG